MKFVCPLQIDFLGIKLNTLFLNYAYKCCNLALRCCFLNSAIFHGCCISGICAFDSGLHFLETDVQGIFRIAGLSCVCGNGGGELSHNQRQENTYQTSAFRRLLQ